MVENKVCMVIIVIHTLFIIGKLQTKMKLLFTKSSKSMLLKCFFGPLEKKFFYLCDLRPR